MLPKVNYGLLLGGMMNKLIEQKTKVMKAFRILIVVGLFFYAGSLYSESMNINIISVIMIMFGLLGYYEWEKLCTENKDLASLYVNSMSDGLSQPGKLFNPLSDYKSLKTRMREQEQEKQAKLEAEGLRRTKE